MGTVAKEIFMVTCPQYLIAQLTGAMFGSWLAYLTYIDHYREAKDEDTVRSTFCTGQHLKITKQSL